jgi:nitrate/nitrite transport system substrate-binding protein
MKFYNDGAVTFPYVSDGMWFLTQHRRWGLLKQDVDYLGVASAMTVSGLFAAAMAAVVSAWGLDK